MADSRLSSLATATLAANFTTLRQRASTDVTAPFRLVPKPDRRELFDRRCVYRGGRRTTDLARASI